MKAKCKDCGREDSQSYKAPFQILVLCSECHQKRLRIGQEPEHSAMMIFGYKSCPAEEPLALQFPPSGKSAREIARELCESIKSGSVMILPDLQWDITYPSNCSLSIEEQEKLKQEIAAGLRIPRTTDELAGIAKYLTNAAYKAASRRDDEPEPDAPLVVEPKGE